MMVVCPDITVQGGAIGTDDIGEQIVIIIVVNRKDYINADPTKDLSEYWIRKKILAQDPVTSQYVDDCIVGALRRHITLDEASVGQQVHIAIDTNTRFVNKDGESAATFEGYVTVDIDRTALVPVRN
jgi:hypothetical protein